ncbi:Utp11 protein-domain-containing protein [Phakopsora pachyrhizi]|uniref:Utp11 protein-domain-containing protein n=1 Tax=Phakopsora pachyrhizi TaxID=170000 RepID=A0AAV0AYG4_PHAPC|nr:Utp11 protein-domain-containing protein [Phakopsora pachyrhizi]CAH7675478.1 Utp11 protein-domain-containing protein [Phakopsora pachyrhizi]
MNNEYSVSVCSQLSPPVTTSAKNKLLFDRLTKKKRKKQTQNLRVIVRLRYNHQPFYRAARLRYPVNHSTSVCQKETRINLNKMARYKLDVQKRQHRERSQPANRQRMGLLEKHKDYSLRARDYHSKQDRIKRLRQKASMKNPDEFYFEMINGRTDPSTGIHLKSRGNRALENDLVKILKTQDFNYVKTCRAIEEKIVGKLKQRLGSIVNEAGDETGDERQKESKLKLRHKISRLVHIQLSATSACSTICDSDNEDGDERRAPIPKKTIFVDSVEKLKSYISKPSNSKNPPKPKEAKSDQDPQAEIQEKYVESLIKQFKFRLKRLRTLQTAERELELTRQLMSKGTKKLIVKGPIDESKRKRKGLINGRDLSWYDKLDRRDIEEEEQEKQKSNEGIKTGAKVWKWKTERKR